MTMCPNTGKACRCQPQEGVMCPSGPTPNDWQGLNMEAERAALCENCRTITTCLEMGCGQGGSTRRVASVVGDDGLPPLPEPDGEADVPVDAERAVFTAVDAWSESLVRQAQRDAIAPYAERIRVLEREAEEMRVSIDQARGICDAVAEALGDDLDREAGSEESIRRLRRAQRPTQSIDTPEFRKLIDRYHDEIDSYKYEYRDSKDVAEWHTLVAYIDGRTAGSVPDGWKLVPEVPTNAMVCAVERKVDEQLVASGMWAADMQRQDGADIYEAALAAAPSPQPGKEGSK